MKQVKEQLEFYPLCAVSSSSGISVVCLFGLFVVI